MRAPRPVPRTVGDSPPPSDAATRLEEATRALGGAEPMGLDEARRVLGRVHGTKDAAELAADRAEAIAQMDLAKATLAGLDTPPSPPAPPPRSPKASRKRSARPAKPVVDARKLRKAARAVLQASVEFRQAESARDRLAAPERQQVQAVSDAVTDAETARERIYPARRRTAGSLISATGMVIVIATVGWPAWAYLVPIMLVLLITADLRATGAEARATRNMVEERMTEAGLDGEAALAGAWSALGSLDGATERLAAATRRREAAWAEWERLAAPGADPEAVEEFISEAKKRPEPDPRSEAPPPPAAPPPAAPPPDPETVARTRRMAEELIDDAQRELAMVAEAEADLALRQRAEHSVAWHEAKDAVAAHDGEDGNDGD